MAAPVPMQGEDEGVDLEDLLGEQDEGGGGQCPQRR